VNSKRALIEMGVSLSKINYCIKKLTKKELIKLIYFTNNPNKMGDMNLPILKGIEKKAKCTTSFLKIKIEKFEVLKVRVQKG
jgi:DNA-binding Lrp family transcriptional regulator